jgi:prepilin-type N-terminal cleavage/methylation domain-containing protein
MMTKKRLEIGDLRFEKRKKLGVFRFAHPISRPPTGRCVQSLISLRSRAFTLVEVLVGAAVFLVVALSAYNAYIGLFKLIDLSQYKVLAVSLANEQFELARNLPYSSVGEVGGIPNGVIPSVQTFVRGGVTFTVETTVRNIDLPFDGTIGGTPNDTSPSDNKYVDVTVSCSGCRDMKPISLTGQIAPKSLETASTNGALFIRVFDANGQPVQGAAVHVVNIATTTTIVIDDVTGANGMLQIVDVPPGVDAYRISVTKNGYSSDTTYPVGGAAGADPLKRDATVIVQQVTQISFAIDQVATLAVSSVTPLCAPVPNVDFTLVGSKLIGSSVNKYSSAHVTNGSGLLTLNSMEWDTYTLTSTDSGYDLAGLNPLNAITVNPGASQQVLMIMIPKTPKTLMVTVKDNSTLLPLSDAEVTLAKSGYTDTYITGKGFINQTDWSGGIGQATSSDVTKYWSDDGRLDTSINSGDVVLKNAFGDYNPAGTLESSTFNTGAPSNFYSLIWNPVGAPPLTGPGPVRFQIATATTSEPSSWSFRGSDGVVGTFYDVSDSPIHSIHSGDQYLRYRIYLATITATVTPNVSDVAFTYTSSCTPPGQVVFPSLTAGTYTLTVEKPGYTTYTVPVTVGQLWEEVQVLLAP